MATGGFGEEPPINVTVHVSGAALRGVPFREFSSALYNLIGERYCFDSIDILTSPKTEVFFGGRTDGLDPIELLEIVRTMTDPAVRDGYFGCRHLLTLIHRLTHGMLSTDPF